MPTITIEIPFGLSADEVVSQQETHDVRSINESLSWLETYGALSETQRILTAAVCAVEAGVSLEQALHTAIIWERG